MIGYTPSHLTENEVILEKLNQIIDYLIKNPSYQVYVYNGGFISGTLTYEIANIINSNNINVADVVVFNNGYYGIISEITETEFTLSQGISIIGPQGPQGPQGPKGDTGTIPEALPQEASALKSGNLPTTGWNAEYSADVFKGTYTNNGSYPNNFYEIPNATAPENKAKLYVTFSDNSTTEMGGTYYSDLTGWQYGSSSTPTGNSCYIRIKTNGQVLGALGGNTITRIATYPISDGTIYNYTISDTSITANSDVLMELTDDGGVKALSIEVGKITVVRDSIPTNNIPYTYKVKQTNASGQFTLVNHMASTLTALPQEASALKNGSLPTNGWNTIGNTLWTGNKNAFWNTNSVIYTVNVNINDFTQPLTFGVQYNTSGTKTATVASIESDHSVQTFIHDGHTFSTLVYADKVVGNGVDKGAGSLTSISIGRQTYTISDTSITANSDVLMELTDDGGVKSYSMEAGKITVIRDTVPTQAIPYTYKVKQTNASGQFTLVNHYAPDVPTKTSELTNDSGFITASDIPSAGEWQNWSDTSVLTEEGLYEIVTTEYPSDGNKTLFVQYEQGKPNNGACWVSVATANSISVVSPICSGDGTLRVERRLANSSDPADLLTFKYRKIN